MKKLKKFLKKQGFTLVELIIVIAIIAVLAIAAFMMLTKWLGKSRDSRRLGDLKTIQTGLEVGFADVDVGNGLYPDISSQDGVVLFYSGDVTTKLAYQGVVDMSVANKASLQKVPLDPSDQNEYTYLVKANRKKFQIMAMLEDGSEATAIFSPVYALDYNNRKATVRGYELGVLLEKDTNLPIQYGTMAGTELNLAGSLDGYTAKAKDNEKLVVGTGIQELEIYTQETLLEKEVELVCPTGFIKVPGNLTFNTETFCVAKYEMSFDTTDSLTLNGRETVNYLTYGTSYDIMSKAGAFPIVNITQQQAIDACKTMGEGYHLITNNEWMTIARNIEGQDSNWSNGSVGDGHIWNGISNDINLGCDGTDGDLDTSTVSDSDTKVAEPTGSSCGTEQRNKLTLSNGEEIWDLAGNVWEYVNKANTEDGSGYDSGTNPDLLTTNNAWGEWSSVSNEDRALYGPAIAVDSTDGIGKVYQADGTIFIRGADADTGLDAGLFTLALPRTSVGQDSAVGFRCAK